jgi:cellulose synthase/poly-beta-1,6-N-acetylglucosamine synthase-like glycosyltransferase
MVILVANPAALATETAALSALYGPFLRPIPCGRAQIEAALFAHSGPAIALAAETRRPTDHSCRGLRARRMAAPLLTVSCSLGLLATLRPQLLLSLLVVMSVAVMLSLTSLKIAASLAAPRNPTPPPPPRDLPSISILIALYGEATIAPRLIRRLSVLDYPQDKLEVLILVEDDDLPTRAALDATALPPWLRVVALPQGTIRTKPRALNIGLDACTGSIIGVYDAEDAPAPDQLRKVAAAFAAAPLHTACLQGMLDFYNPTTNWLARCFTIEYATWFRLILPGLANLGLPIPLGGTTLFLRRAALEQVGGWDAHNVTEDADLGIRLARHGNLTQVLHSTTGEEANCRTLPWIKQRSRWTKGYLMTWLVHMRDPVALWRDLGPRGFAGMQVLLLGSLLQPILAPVLWTLWAFALGLPHPLSLDLSPLLVDGMTSVFLGAEAVTTTLALVAIHRAGHPGLWLWIVTLGAYFPLASFAAAKALAEAVTRPFHWDKTQHGTFDESED